MVHHRKKNCVAVVDKLADLPREPASVWFAWLWKAAELKKPANLGDAFPDVIGGGFDTDQAPALRFGRESKRVVHE
jgi:hypothetical protein